MTDATSAEMLKAFRAERGWSQTTLAERLHVGRRTVEDWEAGRREPNSLLWLAVNFLRQRETLAARIQLMRSGVMRVRVDDQDVTEAQIAEAEAMIADYDHLLIDGAMATLRPPGQGRS